MGVGFLLLLVLIGYYVFTAMVSWVLNSISESNSKPAVSPIQKPVIEELRAKPVQKVAYTGYKKSTPIRLSAKPKWFVVERALEKQMSPAEAIINDLLLHYKCEFYREVAFEGLKTSEYGYARFDFLVVTPAGELIIEYDGKLSHSTPDRIAVDRMKDKFCKGIGIPVIRYSAKHYYNLDKEVYKLLKEYKVCK